MCCEILLVRAILLFIRVFVEFPITVHVDNVGVILLSENTLVSRRTKHIDVHHHFIHDYVEDETVKIQFFHSEGNMADPFTNNLRNVPF